MLDLLPKEIPNEGLNPSLASFKLAVYACGGAEGWRATVPVLGDMERVGVEASSWYYFAVEEVCREVGEGEVGEGEVALLLAMKMKGVSARRKMRRRRSRASDKESPGARQGRTRASVVECLFEGFSVCMCFY